MSSTTWQRQAAEPWLHAETIIQKIAAIILRNALHLFFSANQVLSFTKNLGIGLFFNADIYYKCT